MVGLLLAGVASAIAWLSWGVVWMVVAWMSGMAAVLAHDVYKKRRIKR